MSAGAEPEGVALDEARMNAQQAVRDMRARSRRLGDDGLDLILREARSHYAWTDQPISEAEIRAVSTYVHGLGGGETLE